ncbi:protein transport protein sec31 isoform X2 [Nematostella vectensis]|uniref:protein transport protein sec31 isoform X2 n=1 Tax=Nematostella vectensis TaxID=45351 RepID=UPI00139037EE|nr:protein transport protein sec31 isoform X2 [Nematostella vectensis]
MLASASAVLAYNGDSPRGWNDPPTFAFSGNKSGGSRPKLDLRKRVSHQQALHGGNTPPPQPINPPNPPSYPSIDATNAMAGLSLHSSPRIPPPPSPKHYTPTQPINQVPPPALTTAIPTVAAYQAAHPSAINASPTTVGSPSTTAPSVPSPQAPTHIGQPLIALKSHAFEPVKAHTSIRSTAEIDEGIGTHEPQQEIYNPMHHAAQNGSTCTALVPTPPQAVLPYHPLHVPNGNVPVNTSVGYATPPTTTMLPHQPHPNNIYSSPASTMPPPPLQTHHNSTYSSPVPLAHSAPATPTQMAVGHVTPPPPTFPVSSRVPTPPQGQGLVPPMSSSAGNTPRCLSPLQNDPDDNLGDEEGLEATMFALEDVIQKYSNSIENRISKDITRRLKIMSQMWMGGRLSKVVKTRMIKLAKALDDGQGEEAHNIHVSIMVDHVAEVNQWMVAVKRLISLVRHDPIRPTTS